MARLEQGKFCPLIKEDCIGLKCGWYTQVRGTDTNSGREVDEYACAVTWLPLLLIETSGQVRQAGAAIESARNQAVVASEKSMALQLALAGLAKGLPQLVAATETKGQDEAN